MKKKRSLMCIVIKSLSIPGLDGFFCYVVCALGLISIGNIGKFAHTSSAWVGGTCLTSHDYIAYQITL